MILDEESLEKLSAGVSVNDDLPAATETNEVQEPEEQDVETAPAEPTAEAESEDNETQEPDKEPEDWREKRLAQMAHKKARAEEKLREYEAKLAEYEKTKAQTSEKLPEIPAFPSDDLRYDNPEEWNKQLQAREAAIAKRAQMEFQAQMSREQLTAKQREQQTQQQTELRSIVDKYTASGLEAGISSDKMAYNEEILGEAGVSPDLARYLYSDPKGAQLVDYLASNPAELKKVVEMGGFRAVEYITTAVKPKAGVSKSKATKAPDPIKTTKGTGNATKDDFDKILPAGYSIE